MFGINELKPKILINNDNVECPVKDCNVLVSRQRNSFKKHPDYKCPSHNIYISPSTFEYENTYENILWKGKDDRALLAEIFKVKRESRMARDNSEDAVTWNVFRYLQKNGQLKHFLKELFQIDEDEPEIIYWSYYQPQKGLWDRLKAAREQFELVPSKGSEPDIIILGKSYLIFVEAKLTASNKTTPSNPKVKDKYSSGGQKWWDDVFESDFDTVAVQIKKYELARFWLLGSWIAKRIDKQFILATLVLKENDESINSLFLPYIKSSLDRKFERITWENIYQKINLNSEHSAEKDIMISYIQDKTFGYKNGELVKAFNV